MAADSQILASTKISIKKVHEERQAV